MDTYVQQMAFAHSFVFYLLGFSQSYFELKASSPESDRANYVCIPMASPICQPINMSDIGVDMIPVKLPRTGILTAALVDPEDKDRLMNISSIWRVSSSGYIITSKRTNKKFHIHYMHKEILGMPCTHLNGNRFDNRKHNLAPSRRSKIQRIQDPEYLLKTADPILGFPVLAEDLLIPDIKHTIVEYNSGKKYVGSIKNFKPHGVGKLYEYKENKESWGLWENGVMTNGIVFVYAPLPTRCEHTIDIDDRQVIQSFLVVKNLLSCLPV
jgi:hypothetical protein